MDDRARTRRRLALVLIAVIAPSAAILGLGVRLMLQENTLAESRRADSFEEALDDYADALDAVRFQVPDSLVVFRAPVEGGRLRLPWMEARPVPLTGRFGSLIGDGERAEYSRNAPRLAAQQYTRAIDAADTPRQEALALLNVTRAASRAGLGAEADSARARLSQFSPEVIDEFGVPMALFGIYTEPDRARQLDILGSHASAGLTLAPQAAVMYRTLRDSLRVLSTSPGFATLDGFVERSISATRLQEDFASLFPLLAPRSGARQWLLYDEWLITLEDSGGLLVLDAARTSSASAATTGLSTRGYSTPVLSTASSSPNRFLGPRFSGIYARMEVTGPDPSEPQRLRTAFIALSALLVIGLLTMGVFLIWRDTRRELETARLRSDFVSSVSHELKTPLTSIRMYAETLRLRRQDDAVRDEYLDTIVSESGRLTRLLNNVLDFARIEKGTQRFNKTRVDLQSVVETSLHALSHAVTAGGFQLDTDLPTEPVQVDADPDALEQVVLNLVSNAMKYSGESRDIQVSVRRNGILALLEVADHGIGIAPEDLPHLFEPYYRVRRGAGPKISGTGLGLSIVKHTVDAHDGKVSVESTPGEGTSITISLPLA